MTIDPNVTIAQVKRSIDRAMENIARSDETYSRLLGLRVTSRVHPDVSTLVSDRISSIIKDLDLSQLRLVLLASLEFSSMMYEERSPAAVHRQADNIARALRDAQDAGVA